MYFLVKRVRTNDAASGSLTWREGLRAALLHAAGGACALALLALGVSIVSELFPQSKDTFWRFADSVFSADDEPKVATVRAASPARIEAPEPAPRPARKRRAFSLPRPAAPRPFALPPSPAVPAPQFVDDGPVVLAVASWPTIIPEDEFASLPPRPTNPVVRVLAVLAQPFRLLGGLFHRRPESSRHVFYEDFEAVE